jgi:diguanylate cyclase (GGDEF)-like protein
MINLYELKEQTKSFNILYVEDEEESREQLKNIFDILFAKVDIAVDGADAFEKYNQKSYDLVITDINMPRMNGLELSKKIREINRLQKIIIVSAHDTVEYLLESIRIGVDDIVLKPIEMKQLEIVLSKVAYALHGERLLSSYHSELEKNVIEKTQELAHKLTTDELTGILNRYSLNRKLDIFEYKILLLINIDNFDSINITYGYSNGDLVLKQFTKFLQENSINNSLLYRVNGDEFAFIFTNMTLDNVLLFANDLKEKVSKYILQIEKINIKITLSMAIADGKDENLLKKVQIAIKEAHNNGKNRIEHYKKDSPIELLQARIQEYMPKLREAIVDSYIVPYFQPIINNKTGLIEKFECLARLVSNGEIHTPIQFIDIAELTGMLPEITKIMIDKSFSAFKDNNFSFSINITEYDLKDGYLRSFLQDSLIKYNIDASRVVLEVLEGISADGAQNSLQQLFNFKEDGFAIAIDDFGTQNSNFQRVQSMQCDFIKIDGSFIKDILSNQKSFNVSKTINDFSKSIGAKVIAEFVHNKATLDIVIELGIEYSQGYYLGEPKPYIIDKIDEGIFNEI